MKRIFKNKFIACIIAAAVALLAAVFAVFYLNKNDAVEAHAEAATTYTPTVYWGLSGSGNNLTLTFSHSPLVASYKTVTGNSFDGDFDFDVGLVPWRDKISNIKTVNFLDSIVVKSTGFWFAQGTNLENVYNLSNLDTSLATDMSGMFMFCNKLKEVDVSGFKTANVTSIGGMFYQCLLLKEIDVSNWNTSNMTNMYNVFNGCTALESIDVSKWDTSSATIIANIFRNCSSLKSIDVSGFDVDNLAVESATQPVHDIFSGCTSLEKIKLSDSIVEQILVLNNSDFEVTAPDTKMAGLAFPLYDLDGNEYNSETELTKGAAYYTSPHEHTYKVTSTIKPATCKEEGENEVTCTDDFCKHVTTEPIPTTNGEHSYGAWVEKTPATCTTDRKEERTCSKCANKEEQTVAGTKLGHLYGDPVWEWAADYSSATAKFTCTRSGCGYIHSLPGTVSTSTTPSTCMLEGKTTYTATIAVTGAEFQQSSYTSDPQEVPIDKLSHIAATTWAEGTSTHWHECTLGCDTKLDEATHAYTIWKVDTAATVTSTGVGHHECVCGARGADEEIPMETCSHTNKSHVPAVEATCIATGNPEYWTCGDCGKNLNAANTEISTIVTPVDPDNHKAWGEWQPETAATCTEKGSEKRVCGDCSHEETRETAIDPNAHDIEHHEAKTASCTEAGWGAYDTCKRTGCDYTTYSEIPALDHNWASVWSKDETNHWHECTVCGEKKDEAAHTYEWIITKEPTEEETGEKEERCTVCEYANGNVETIAKLVVDDNGNVSDLPPDKDYDLEIAVKESESKYNVAGVNKGYVVELYIVNGEDRTPYGADKSVILKLVIPEGMEEFVLYRMSGDRLTEVAADEYKVEGGMLSIRTTLPDEFVFNAPVTETEEPSAGIPWWVWLIVGLVAVAIVGVVIIIIVVIKKKNGGDGGTTVVQGTNYDDAELKAKLSAQDRKLDEIKEIVDGGFNDVVDE